jgi:Xaa-Pro aminopeptidase
MIDLNSIQTQLRDVDGWLFFDHHRRDPMAYRILGLHGSATATRRWFYWVPVHGAPVKLVHRIEAGMLDGLPGERWTYSSWHELHEHLRAMLSGARRVAMQYSPLCALPAISMVDAGTVELVRSFGAEVVSSAGLVQFFEARWTPAQREMHLEAGRRVDRVLDEAFARVGDALRRGDNATEYEIAQFIRRRFAENGLVADHGPIVAVNAHSGDPHYEPAEGRSSPICAGDHLLIDLWAKLAEPGAVYYDITWVAQCRGEIPERVQRVFDLVCGARDLALDVVRSARREGRVIAGWEVDEAARAHIAAHGHADHFTHRLGHSIGEDIHGAGANVDNFETRDTRPLIPDTCFSIEPGIYLPEFGVRSEINCFVTEGDAAATGRVQKQMVLIL